MITALSAEQFIHTLQDGMVEVTDSAEPAFDIWPYVKQLNEQGVVADSIFTVN